jgi:hypothetical protein
MVGDRGSTLRKHGLGGEEAYWDSVEMQQKQVHADGGSEV